MTSEDVAEYIFVGAAALTAPIWAPLMLIGWLVKKAHEIWKDPLG